MTQRITVITFLALITLGLAISAHAFTFTRDKHSATVPADKARVVVTEQLGLLKIDTEKYNRYAFNSGDTIVDVTPGQHVFSVRYDWLWEYDYDNFDPLKSDPVSVTIQTEAGKTYTITHRDIPDYPAALAFSRKPEMQVIEAGSGTRVRQPAPEAASTSAAQPVEQAPAASQPKSNQATATVAATSTVAATPAGKSAASTSRPAQAQPSSLPMLQYWWSQASPSEQKQFRDWIQSR
jgi:uncharacterized protein YccT (UPF0319 family)